VADSANVGGREIAESATRRCNRQEFALNPRFAAGIELADDAGMGVKTLEELQAYQAVRALKLEVYRLVEDNARVNRDPRFRDQLMDAAASAEMNVAEGFRRFSAGDFSRFLKIARGSLEETCRWIQDGVDRRHFTTSDVAPALDLGDRAGRLLTGLIMSLKPFLPAPPSPGRKKS
jgi:four helix bundle protein